MYWLKNNLIFVTSSHKDMRSIGPLRDGGEPPKRRRWRMKRGGEVKKQGAMRSASSKQGDYVSEGQVDCEQSEQDGCGDIYTHPLPLE